MSKTYHFIGVGGAGMSGIAEYLVTKGNVVSGSDMVKSGTTDELIKTGVEVFIGHSKNNLPRHIDSCVYSAAVGEDNVELAECRRRGVKVISRAEALNMVTADFKNFIAVSGCHGKTTTTALIFQLLSASGLEPTMFLGGEYKGKNFLGGAGEYCVAEACEFRRSFLNLRPSVSVILNVDRDHVDCYESLKETEDAFFEFADSTRQDGVSVVYSSVEKKLKNRGFGGKTITFSDCEDADYLAKNVTDVNGIFSYDLYEKGVYLCRVDLPLCGYYLVPCSLAAIAVCRYFGCEVESLVRGIKDFVGLKRRWQAFESNFTNVVADYAHHPSEIKSLIFSAKKADYDHIFVLFQPHTYSRTLGLIDEFATCFDGAALVAVLPTYAAREKPIKGGESKDLVKAVARHTPCVPTENFADAKRLFSFLTKKDLLLVVGAGNVIDFCVPDFLNK